MLNSASFSENVNIKVKSRLFEGVLFTDYTGITFVAICVILLGC